MFIQFDCIAKIRDGEKCGGRIGARVLISDVIDESVTDGRPESSSNAQHGRAARAARATASIS
jgi:hypothetical protein